MLIRGLMEKYGELANMGYGVSFLPLYASRSQNIRYVLKKLPCMVCLTFDHVRKTDVKQLLNG